jgi:hypothetical protein
MNFDIKKLIGLVTGILAFTGNGNIHAFLVPKLLIPRNVHDPLKKGMSATDQKTFDRLRQELAKAEADYLIFAATAGEIEPDEE